MSESTLHPQHHVNPSVPRPAAPVGLPKVSAIPTLQAHASKSVEDDSISLVESTPSHPVSKIQFSGRDQIVERKYKRQSNLTGTHACHVKSFHGRLSDEGLDFLDTKINDWLEAHHDVEVKFVTTSIGLYDGKIKENAMIINVWF